MLRSVQIRLTRRRTRVRVVMRGLGCLEKLRSGILIVISRGNARNGKLLGLGDRCACKVLRPVISILTVRCTSVGLRGLWSLMQLLTPHSGELLWSRRLS